MGELKFAPQFLVCPLFATALRSVEPLHNCHGVTISEAKPKAFAGSCKRRLVAAAAADRVVHLLNVAPATLDKISSITCARLRICVSCDRLPAFSTILQLTISLLDCSRRSGEVLSGDR